MTKRETIALIVQSWSLFPNRKERHAWVRAKQLLDGKPVKVKVSTMCVLQGLKIPRSYAEATGYPAGRKEFA